jgi:hypothetical protein
MFDVSRRGRDLWRMRGENSHLEIEDHRRNIDVDHGRNILIVNDHRLCKMQIKSDNVQMQVKNREYEVNDIIPLCVYTTTW